MVEEKMANGKLSKRNKSNTNSFLAVTVIILVIIITAGAGLVYFHIIPNLEDRVCQISEKFSTIPSTDLITLVDSSSDPCESFTRFICNRREETSLGKKLLEMRARTFLKRGMAERWRPLEIVRKFYESCRDTNSMDEIGNDRILIILKRFELWPLWNQEPFDFNLTDFLDQSLAMNLPFEWLFRISVNAVPISDQLETMAQLAPPENLNDFKRENHIARYAYLMYTTLDKLYNKLVTKEHIEKIVDFEKNLTEHWESFNSSKTVPITNNELSKIFSIVDISILTKWLPENVSRSQIAVDMNVMKKLNLFLKETPNRTLAHFLVWRVVEHYGFFLHKDLRGRFEHFHNFISREELCLNEAKERFPKVLDLFYKKFYLKPEKKIDYIDEMTSTIKAAISSKIESTKWIDEATSDLIVNKLNEMSLNLKVMDNIDKVLIQAIEASVDEVFQLNDTFSDIFETLGAQNRFLLITRLAFMNLTSMDLLEVLQKPVPGLVEYNENNNELVFSHMTLDDYIFNTEQPPYRNYGLLGTRISREMSKSIQIDALYGNDPSRSHLWRNNVELDERTACLRNLNQDDVFVDIVGVDFAYEAYLEQEIANRQQTDSKRNRQLFWRVYGLTSCGEPDGRARLEMLNQSRGFGEDFGCAVGSNMNPVTKCSVF